MIEFGLMNAEGFASIERAQFNWAQPGLNIVQAPNGSGKTTFINALVWCLYGKTLSGSVEPWEDVKGKNYKGTRVSVMFFSGKVPHVITRFKDYGRERNRLKVSIGGDDIDVKEKKDIQVAINNMLGYTYDLFKNSIIFGQKLKRLIAETGPNKKKVFDDAFEIAYIPKAKKLIEVEMFEVNTEIQKQQVKVNNITSTIKFKEEELESDRVIVENFERDKKAEIDDKEVRIQSCRIDLKNKLAELTSDKFKGLNDRIQEKVDEKYTFSIGLISHEDVNKLVRKEARFSTEVNQDKTEIGKLESKVQELSLNAIMDTCNECGNKLTRLQIKEAGNRKLKNIEDRIDQVSYLKTNISRLQEKIEGISTEISSAKTNRSKYELALEEYNALEKDKLAKDSIEKDITLIKAAKKRIKWEIQSIKDRTLGINLGDMEATINRLYVDRKPELKKLKKLEKTYEVKKWISDKPLSNSGLKAFIFDEMMDSINERLLFYSRYIGFQVEFMVDMDSHHRDLKTYVYKGEHLPVPYDDLSGGQQQSVDIVSAFAIHDVVSDTKSCNLLVMDELFESLDKDNVEIMTELIQDKAKDKSLFLITHNPEFCPTNANIIRIKYEKGLTSLL